MRPGVGLEKVREQSKRMDEKQKSEADEGQRGVRGAGKGRRERTERRRCRCAEEDESDEEQEQKEGKRLGKTHDGVEMEARGRMNAVIKVEERRRPEDGG